MKNEELSKVKKQILAALAHPEADEGLYFRNLFHLHEEDERPAVIAEESEILDALKELMRDGQIKSNDGNGEPIFTLVV